GMSHTTPITPVIKTQVLIANRHSCCVCGSSGVQIHHINGDNSDHREENLAVLCLTHHDKATSPPSLTAALKADQIRIYKRDWETGCKKRCQRLARSRTA